MKRLAYAFGFATLLLSLQLVGCSDQTTQIDPAMTEVDPDKAEQDKSDGADDLGVEKPNPGAEAEFNVEAGGSQFSDANLLISLNGKVTANNRTITQMRWAQVEGPEATLLTPDTHTTQVLLPDVSKIERLTFRLSAADSEGLVATDTVSVIVQPLNTAVRVIGAAVQEGAETAAINFRIALLQPAQQALTLEYSTADRSAEAGKDYTATTGSVTFEPGERDKIVSVPIIDDQLREGSEVLVLSVSRSDGIIPSTIIGTAVIIDDETGDVVTPSKPMAVPIDQTQDELGEPRGTVRVHLVWTVPDANLDLQVEDPCKQAVSNLQRSQTCEQFTGVLDHDNIDEGITVLYENVYWADGAPRGDYTVRVAHSGGPFTPYTVYIYFGDQEYMYQGVVGNGLIETITTFNHKPLVQFTSPAQGATVQGNITISGTLAGTQIEFFTLSINGTDDPDVLTNREGTTFSVAIPAQRFRLGENTIEISITDVDGNNDRAVLKINYAPVVKPNPVVQVEIISPVQDAELTGPQVLIAGTARVEGGTIAQLQATVNSVTSINVFSSLMNDNFQFPVLKADLLTGVNTVEVVAWDAANNANTAEVQFNYTPPPPAPPQLTIDVPQPLDVVRGETVAVSGSLTIEEGDLVSFEAQLNEMPPFDLTPFLAGENFSFEIASGDLTLGENTLNLTATTSLNTGDSAEVTFNYELDPLVLTLTQPASDASVSSNVPVLGTVDSINTLASLQAVLNDGTPWSLLDTVQNGQFAFTLTPEQLLLDRNTLVVTASDAASGEKTADLEFVFDPTVAPEPGGDLVVINDLGVFEQAEQSDNAALIQNLVNYENSAYPRASGQTVLFDLGRGSACAAEACDAAVAAARAAIEAAGFIVEDSASATGALTTPPTGVKALFLWLPQAQLAAEEVTALKQFAREGGRIVLIGEEGGIEQVVPYQNHNLAMLSASLRNQGGSFAEAGSVVLGEPVHQITEGLESIAVDAASRLRLAMPDYPLLATAEGQVLASVSRINLNSIAPEFRAPQITVLGPQSSDTLTADTTFAGEVALGDGPLASFEATLNGEVIADSLDELTEDTFSIPVPADSLAEGENTLSVSVTDINGEDDSESVTFTYDPPVNPIVTITSPNATETYQDDVTVTGTVLIEGASIETVMALVNGEVQISPIELSSDGSFSFVLNGELGAGSNSVRVTAISSIGTRDFDSVTFMYADPQDPAVTILEPRDKTVFRGDVPVIAQVLHSEPVTSVAVFVNDVRVQTVSVGDSEGPTNIGVDLLVQAGQLTIGPNTIRIAATGSNERVGADSVEINYIPLVSPQIEITTPKENDQLFNQVQVSGTASIAAGELASLTAVVNSGPPIELLDENFDGTFEFTLTSDELVEGLNTLTITAVSDQGMETPKSVPFNFTAAENPVVEIATPANNSEVFEGFNLTGRVSVANAEVTSLVAKINQGPDINLFSEDFAGEFSLAIEAGQLSEGVNEIEVIATADNNLPGSAKVRVTYIPASAPEVIIENPLPETRVRDEVILSGSVSIEVGEIVSLQAFINEGDGIDLLGSLDEGEFSLTLTMNDLVVGVNTIQVVATNNSGVSTPAEVTFEYYVPNAPIIEIITPAAGVDVSGDTVLLTVSASVPGGEIASIEVEINSGTPLPLALGEDGLYSLNIADQLVAGTNMLEVTAVSNETVGTVEDFVITYVVPNAPTIELLMPLDNAEVEGDFILSGTVTHEGEALASLVVQVNGQEVVEEAGVTGEFSYTIAATSLTPGNNTIQVFVTDVNGEPANDMLNVVYLPPAPVVDITEPTQNSEQLLSVTVVGNVLPASGALTSLTATVNGVELDETLLGEDFDGTFSFTLTADQLVEGENTVTVTAVPEVGESGSDSVTFNFSVPVEPTIVISSPDDGASVSGGFTVTGMAAVNGGTITSLLASINMGDAVELVGEGFDGPFSLDVAVTQLVEGENSIVFTATSATGSMATETLSVIYTPPTLPEVEVTAPLEGNNLPGPITLTGTASIEVGEISSLQAVLNNSETPIDLLPTLADGLFSATLPEADLIEGSNTLVITAGNNAGDSIEPIEINFEYYIPQVPVVMIETPANETVVEDEVVLSGTAAVMGGSIQSLSASVNEGESIALTLTDGAFSQSITDLVTEGVNTVVVTAVSDDEVPGTATATFTFSAPAIPQVEITAPMDGATVSGEVTVIGTAMVEGAEIESVTALVNQEMVPVTFNAEDGTFSIVLSGQLVAGDNTIQVTALSSENRSGGDEIGFIYELPLAPVITVLTPTDDEVIEEAVPITVSGSVEPGGLSLSLLEVYLNDGDTPIAMPTLQGLLFNEFSLEINPSQLAFGENTLRIVATPLLGPPGMALRSFTYAPILPPEVTILTPMGDAVLRDLVEVTGTVKLTFGELSTVVASIDAGEPFAVFPGGDGNFGFDLTKAELTDGPHTVTVTATTGAGEVDDDSVTFSFVASDAPVVTFDSPASGDVFIDGFTVSGSARVSVGAIDSVSAVINPGTEAEEVIEAPLTADFTFDVSPAMLIEGDNTISVIAVSDTGLEGMGSLVVTYTAPTLPEVNVTAPTEGDSLPGPITLTGTASIEVGEITTLQAVLNDSETPINLVPTLADGVFTATLPEADLIEGSNTLVVTASNNAGDSIEPIEINFEYFVAQTPVITIVTPEPVVLTDEVVLSGTIESNVVSSATFSVNGEPAEPLVLTDGAFSVSITDRVNAGENFLTVGATSGNKSTSSTFDFVVAPTPAVGITSPVAGETYEGEVTVSGTASIEGGEITSLMALVNDVMVPVTFDAEAGTFSFVIEDQLGAGSNTVQVTAISDLGKPGFDMVMFDYTVLAGPTVELLMPFDNAEVAGDFVLSGTVTHEGEALASLVVQVNGQEIVEEAGVTGEFSYTIAATSLTPGNNTIQVFVTDVNGEPANDMLNVVYTPPAPVPVVTLTSPTADSDQLFSVELAGTVMLASGELTSLTATVNEGEPIILLGEDFAGEFGITLDAAQLVDGQNTVVVTAVSDLGEEGFAPVTFNFSNPPEPTVTFIAPEDGAAVSGAFTVSGTAGVAEGSVISLMASVGGDEPGELIGEGFDGTFSFAVVPTQLNEGENTIEVVATTDAGQMGSAILTVIYAPAFNPVVKIASPVDDSSIRGGSDVSLTGTINLDAGATLDTLTLVRVLSTGEEVVIDIEPVVDGATFTYTLTEAELPFGENTLRVSAIDSRSLGGSQEVTFFHTEPQNPVVSISTPTGEQPIRGGSVAVAGSFVLEELAEFDTISAQVSSGGVASAVTDITVQGGTFSFTLTETELTYGINLLEVVVSDNGGLSGVAEVTIDYREPVPPVIEFAMPVDGTVLANGSDLAVSGLLTLDELASLSQLQAHIQTGDVAGVPITIIPEADGTFTFVIPAAQLPEGANTLVLTALDDGGASTTAEIEFTYEALLPFAININSPQDAAALVLGEPISLSLTLSRAPISLTGVLVQGETTQAIELPLASESTATIPTANLNSGPALIQINAVDESMIPAQAEVEVVLLSDVPVVNITAPEPNAAVSGQVTLTGTTSIGIGSITALSVSVNDDTPVGLTPAPEGGPFNAVLGADRFSNGENTITVTAANGEKTGIKSVIVNYQHPAPVVMINSPLPDTTVNGGLVVEGTANVSTGGIATLSATLNGAEPFDILPDFEGGVFAFEVGFEQLQAGPNTISVVATDDAGTASAPATVTFTFADAGLHLSLDAAAAAGVFADSLGFNNTATPAEGFSGSSQPGVDGGAILFDGTSALSVADHAEVDLGTGDFSMFVWIKTTNTASLQTILDKRLSGSGPGYLLHTYNGNLLFQMADSSGHENFSSPTTPIVTDGFWHHVGVTVDRDQGGQLWVDGEIIWNFAATDFPGSMDNATDLLIGAHAGSGEDYIGLLDDLWIVKRVLTQAEIDEHLSLGLAEQSEPVITIAGPVGDTPISAPSVIVSGTVAVAGEATVVNVYAVDSAGADHPATEFDGQNFRIEIAGTSLAPGTNVIEVFAVTSVPTTASQPVTFDYIPPVQSIPPNINVTSPQGGDHPGGPVVVSGELGFDEGAEFASLDVTLTDESGAVLATETPTVDAQGNFTFTLPEELFQAGIYTLEFHAVDTLGKSDTEDLSFTYLDLAPLTVTLNSPQPDEVISADLSLTGLVTWDPAAELTSLTATLVNGNDVPQYDLTGLLDGDAFNLIIPASQLTAGVNEVSVTAGDQQLRTITTKVSFTYRPVTNPGLLLSMDKYDGGPTIDDEMGFNNIATVQPGDTLSVLPGAVGNAARFDGKTYLTVNNHPEVDVGSANVSMFMWVRTLNGNVQTLAQKFSRSAGYTFRLTRGLPSLMVTSAAESTEYLAANAPAVNDGLWHLVGVTVARAAQPLGQIYVDGKMVLEFDLTPHRDLPFDSDAPLLIGASATTEDFFTGDIDELLLAKRVLQQDEIEALIATASVAELRRPVVTITNPAGELELLTSVVDLTGFVRIGWGGELALVQATLNKNEPIALDIDEQGNFMQRFTPSQLLIDRNDFTVEAINSDGQSGSDSVGFLHTMAPVLEG